VGLDRARAPFGLGRGAPPESWLTQRIGPRGDRCKRQPHDRNSAELRIGGEAFASRLGGCTPEAAAEVLERLRVAVGVAILRSNCPAFTVGFGVADGAHADDCESLFTAADRALYPAKANGRDRIVIFGANETVAA
jgi:predicted signal transduction protein with EAL and GGDEF domain